MQRFFSIYINALAKASRDYLNGPVTAYPFVNNIRSDLEQVESQNTDNGTSGKYPISQRVEKSENFWNGFSITKGQENNLHIEKHH